ncbi:MAG: hypothetical protein RI967_2304 [Planctomycetota bacterium]
MRRSHNTDASVDDDLRHRVGLIIKSDSDSTDDDAPVSSSRSMGRGGGAGRPPASARISWDDEDVDEDHAGPGGRSVTKRRGSVRQWVHDDGNAGVWGAAMMLPCVLAVMVGWFAASVPSRESGALDWVLAAVGLAGAAGAAWCLVVLARARRVREADWSARLRLLAGVGFGAGALAFVAPLAGLEEPVATVARFAWIGPSLLVAGCGMTVVRIARGKHGSAVARPGIALAIVAGVAPFVVDSRVLPPLVFAVAVSAIGVGGVRLWRRYELALIQGERRAGGAQARVR